MYGISNPVILCDCLWHLMHLYLYFLLLIILPFMIVYGPSVWNKDTYTFIHIIQDHCYGLITKNANHITSVKSESLYMYRRSRSENVISDGFDGSHFEFLVKKIIDL